MMIHWYDPSVRLTGRWSRNLNAPADYHTYDQRCPDYATTTAPGSYFELAFRGRSALLKFDLGLLLPPFPHLWISVDGGSRIEVPVDRFLRVEAPDEGSHVVKVLYKGGCEKLPRWYGTLAGCISFIGAEADAPGELPEDNRPLIEFIGDSITEGVLIDTDYSDAPADLIDQLNRPYQDDNCATYAALLAERLNLRSMFQAYGAVGLTRVGCGSVPRAGLLYPWCYDGTPYEGEKPDIVMINHGANDRAATAEEYLMRYGEFLDLVRETNPSATIIALSAFVGAFNDELAAFIPEYNAKNNANVHFISSKGWVPAEPLHPMRDGHRTIADHLVPIVKDILNI